MGSQRGIGEGPRAASNRRCVYADTHHPTVGSGAPSERTIGRTPFRAYGDSDTGSPRLGLRKRSTQTVDCPAFLRRLPGMWTRVPRLTHTDQR